MAQLNQAGTIRKEMVVPVPVPVAFRAFTRSIGRWWPLATHSLSAEHAATCLIVERVGGSVFELDDQGVAYEWGRVLEWTAPHRLLLSWHPGRAPESSQTLEVSFSATPEGTRVLLEHRDWQRLGERATRMRSEYEGGWDLVLALFAAAAGNR